MLLAKILVEVNLLINYYYMKNLTKIFIFSALSFSTVLSAQVKFKIERVGDQNNFVVYAVPSETYDGTKRLTSTAQVTLLAPTGDFEFEKIVNLNDNAKWRVNGRTNNPKENPNFDYLYFGLENLGTNALEYIKNRPLPWFLIQAKTCNTSLALMDNASDPFMYPNSHNVNVGNQITIFGAGGDAFQGNIEGEKEVTCIKGKDHTMDKNTIRISPNITLGGMVSVEFMNDTPATSGEITIIDASSRRVFNQAIEVKKGYNSLETDISNYSNGMYYVILSGIYNEPISEKLIIGK